MAAILNALGLTPTNALDPTPSYGAYYLIFHFLYAYAILSSRIVKLRLGMDHQVSPREDVAKYGQIAVEKGKITQRQLNTIKRIESCHANSIENFTLFTAAMVLAHISGVPNHVINTTGLAYTLVRFAYALNYILAETHLWAAPRGVLWWAGNIICLRLLWKAGNAYNAQI